MALNARIKTCMRKQAILIFCMQNVPYTQQKDLNCGLHYQHFAIFLQSWFPTSSKTLSPTWVTTPCGMPMKTLMWRSPSFRKIPMVSSLICFGCQPDEPLTSLVTNNRIINVYGFIVVIILLMFSALHCLYSLGKKITTICMCQWCLICTNSLNFTLYMSTMLQPTYYKFIQSHIQWGYTNIMVSQIKSYLNISSQLQILTISEENIPVMESLDKVMRKVFPYHDIIN